MMDAITAKQITTRNLRGPVIDRYVEGIDKAIREAAECGESLITVNRVLAQLRDSGIDWPSIDVKNAIRKHYENAGFTYVCHRNPDPGHPASAPYDSIEW